ncbi:MAG: transcriptional regulator [Clostridia bacterium]|nr:transcriptional regulator [Clostridia bacterium]
MDLAILLERAINRELSETERETVVDRWFNSLTQTQISRKRGISPAAVKNTLDRAQEKLERVLSYVVCYQQNVADESIIPLALGRARVIAAARNASGGTSGDRLLRLRQSQSMSRQSLNAATGISLSRIEHLENGDLPKTDELLALSEFFDVTVDFILKGERYV